MSAVPSGLESSMTMIELFRFSFCMSRMRFSMFCASRYVGSITAIDG